MLKSAIRLLKQKWMILFLTFLLVVGIPPLKVISQEITPSFKIVGKTQHVFTVGIMLQKQLRAVEYDSLSPDHLIISDLGDSNRVLIKTRYLFKGNRFSLPLMDNYQAEKKLIMDGIQSFYNEDQNLVSEQIYKEGVLQRNTFFYNNGTKQTTYCEDKEQLNGEFIMWYPNGQISFMGNYKNNLKDGQFESFDASGMSERKGTYREGKLIEGISVVQDLLYDTPEMLPHYKDNDSIFNEVVALKSANLEALKKMKGGIIRNLDLKFTISKTGKINKVEITGPADAVDKEIVNSVFNNEFEGFEPALMEGAPVSGYYKKSFFISDKGLQVNTTPLDTKKDINAYSVVTEAEEMPEFPGLEKGLMQFLAKTIKYPMEAMENGIQGKVFVTFIIMEDGTVANVAIVRGVHYLLDNEAVRVIQQMPKWKPGRHDGKPVRVSYTIPINFVSEVSKENRF